MVTRRLAPLAVLFVSLLFPTVSSAARPFAEVYSNVSQGAFARAANSVMTCDRTREANTRCDAIESTTGTLQFNNNDTYTRWIDIDGIVDANNDGVDDTYNSSSADIAVPATARVVWAGLYWQGNTRSTSQRTATAPAPSGEVLLETPGTTGYSTVNSTWCSTLGDRYACFADVLSEIPSNANGTYTVANVRANTGQDDYIGGWELFIVYEDDSLPLRSLTIYDGHAQYGGGTSSIFDITGFLTPLMGTIAAEVGVTIAEGDRGTGDSLVFQSEQSATSTTITSDLGDGSISEFGANVITRSPAFRNTLGHDSDLFDVSSLMVNGDQSATITLPGASGETNDLVKVDFAVDVYFPNVTTTKTFTDLNGGDLVEGDTIRYTINVENDPTAFDTAVNVVVTDELAPELDFVPGTITVTSTPTGGPAIGSKTDAPGDDVATWDSTMRTLTVNVGDGATATSGGELAAGESMEFTFDVVVLPTAVDKSIDNSAVATYEGATLSSANITRVATSTSDDPTTAPQDSTTITPDDDPDGDGTSSSDMDEDNDGILDIDEGFGVDSSQDSDGDGIRDYEDPDTPGFVDANGDGVDDRFDTDGDGIPNHLDLDSDSDGIFDIIEARGATLDTNGDGRIDSTADVDSDGVSDVVDADQNGTPLPLIDTDADGDLDPYDPDDDGDGILTATESNDASIYGADIDGDGIPPWYDTESDGDGILDADETADIDADGVPDYLDPDQSIIVAPADGSLNTTGVIGLVVAAEANAGLLVEVVDSSGAVVSSTTGSVGANGQYSAQLGPLPDGSYEIRVTATDAGGATFTDSVTVTVDLVFVTILLPADGSTTGDPTPELVGTTEPGLTVTLVLDAGTAAETTLTTTANANGDWFIFSPFLTDGSHTLEATVDDGTSTASDSVTFTVDTAPPALTLTNPSNNDVTNDTTPPITGTSDPGASVEIFIDGALVATVTTDANGDWSFTPTTPLAEGGHLVEVRTTDDSGNEATANARFQVDTTPPVVALNTPADGATVGSPTPAITGTAEPGSTVEITIDGIVVATVTTDANGDWSYVPATPLPDGVHTASVTATDEAGNTSPSASNTFTVDSTLPAVQILDPAEGSATNDPMPTITGTADPNAMVSISIDGMMVGTATADPNGDWSFMVATALADGPHSATASVDDGTNTNSDTVNFTVDTMPPTLAITSPSMGETVSATPTISGETDPNTTVIVTLPDGSTLRTTSDANGDWSIVTTPLPAGTVTVTATARDDAGNETTEMVSFEVDAAAPFVRIDNPNDNSTKNDPLLPFDGTTDQPGATVVLLLDGVEVGRPTADANGNWTFTPTTPLSEGVHTLTATVTDAVGNEGSDTVDFIIDSRAPDVDIVSPGENEEVTTARPTFSGTAAPNTDVDIYVDGDLVATVTSDANGDWSYTAMMDIPEGEHTVLAEVTDAAGNVGNDQHFFTIDTVPPFVTIFTPADGSSTPDPTPTITGEAKPGDLVEIFVDGTKVGETTADSNGDWSFTLGLALAEGAHTVSATADGAMDSNDFVVDQSAPMVTIDSPVDGELTNDDTPTISGSTEPGATVEIFVDGTKVGEATADANGDWSFTSDELSDGDHTIEATSTDDAGNTGSSGVITITVDTTPPDLTVDSPEDGDSAEGGTTVSGTAEPGSTVEVFVDGMKVGETTADDNGDWEVEIDDPGEGEHDITVIASDPAGNSSEVGPIVVTGTPVAANNNTGNNNAGNNGTGNNNAGNNGTGNNGTGPDDDDAFQNATLEGGCAQAGGTGGWLPLLLIGLFVFRRRRERAR